MVNFDGSTHLLQYINLVTEENIYHSLACELLKQQNRIPTCTITEIADACFVSTATLSRFCKKLGYKDYVHFKESFSKSYSFEHDYTNDFLSALEMDPENTIRSLHLEINDAIAMSAKTLDFVIMDKILKKIHDSQDIAFFSSNLLQQLAADIQQRLQKLGKMTYAFTRNAFQTQHIENMNENSLAIFISVNGNQLLSRTDQIAKLKERNVPIILITQNPHTILENDALYTLFIGGSNQNDTGRFCTMYVLEAMLIRYYQLFGKNNG